MEAAISRGCRRYLEKGRPKYLVYISTLEYEHRHIPQSHVQENGVGLPLRNMTVQVAMDWSSKKALK